MEHAKHIIRAVLLLVIVVVVLIVARHFAIPESYGGPHGQYRLDSVGEYAAQAPAHGEVGVCADCHDREAEAKSAGKHSSVSCDVCHAPLADHVQAGQRVAEMPIRRSYSLCAWCHQRLDARPAEFPQVVLPDHVTEQETQMSENVCLECHDDAHNPSD